METAVLCIVLVPMLLYAFFLDDLLRYKLDLAEAVFASPWDYTTVNYEDPGDYAQGSGQTSVQHNIRLGLCDHTTAYNSYDGSYECEGKGGNGETSIHHVALSAHECWMVPGAHQVTCTLANQDVGTEQLGQLFTSGIKGVANKGGQIHCQARLAVINYYLPQKVLQSFSKVLTTRTEEKSGDVHAHYQNLHDVDGSNTYILEQQDMSIITDTWALTTVEDVDPDSNSGKLYDRVSPGYPMLLAMQPFMNFAMKLQQDQLLSFITLFDIPPMGDMVLTPQVGFKTAAPPSIGDFYSSAWDDNGQDPVEKSYNDRGNHYLGATQLPSN